jgi:hypothetical protein
VALSGNVVIVVFTCCLSVRKCQPFARSSRIGVPAAVHERFEETTLARESLISRQRLENWFQIREPVEITVNRIVKLASAGITFADLIPRRWR